MALLRKILLQYLQLPLQARLALRNIRRQRSRTVLTMLSMAGGFVVCAVSISIQHGSYGAAVDTFVRDQTGHLQVFHSDYLERPRIHKLIREPDVVRARVVEHPGVVAATARVFAPALAYSIDNKSAPARVVGVDVENERLVTSLLGGGVAGVGRSELRQGHDGCGLCLRREHLRAA